MSIDWTIVAAQLANFLVLVWLLKRFLYRPILDGIDAREAEIADRMQQATQARESADTELKEYQSRIESFRAEQATLTSEARRKAEADRDLILRQGQEQLIAERVQWHRQLQEEGHRYMTQLQQLSAQIMVQLMGKALGDLVDETLEHRIVGHVIARLRPMTRNLQQSAAHAAVAVATTREPLSAAARKQLSTDLEQIVPGIPIQFETDPAQSPGLVFRLGGAQISWTIEDYISGLNTLLQQQLAALNESPESAAHV